MIICTEKGDKILPGCANSKNLEQICSSSKAVHSKSKWIWIKFVNILQLCTAKLINIVHLFCRQLCNIVHLFHQ